jgi:hypothetical protein
MEAKTRHNVEAFQRKERAMTALARLQSLKSKVTELRLQCEALQKLQLEKPKKILVCHQCGKLIKNGKEVAVKDSLGKVRSHYHKDCFKAIWLSQTCALLFLLGLLGL